MVYQQVNRKSEPQEATKYNCLVVTSFLNRELLSELQRGNSDHLDSWINVAHAWNWQESSV